MSPSSSNVANFQNLQRIFTSTKRFKVFFFPQGNRQLFNLNVGNGDEDGAVSVGLVGADAGLEMFSRKFEARDRSG